MLSKASLMSIFAFYISSFAILMSSVFSSKKKQQHPLPWKPPRWRLNKQAQQLQLQVSCLANHFCCCCFLSWPTNTFYFMMCLHVSFLLFSFQNSYYFPFISYSSIDVLFFVFYFSKPKHFHCLNKALKNYVVDVGHPRQHITYTI